MVVIDQPGDYEPPRDHKGYSYAAGTLAEVVLVVTDLAGVVHTYYQDLRVEVERLPKYGALSTVVASTPSSYAAWRNSFELKQIHLRSDLIKRVQKLAPKPNSLFARYDCVWT